MSLDYQTNSNRSIDIILCRRSSKHGVLTDVKSYYIRVFIIMDKSTFLYVCNGYVGGGMFVKLLTRRVGGESDNSENR